MRNKRLLRTLSALCLTLVLALGFTVPAFAQGAAPPPAEDTTNDSNVVVDETEKAPPLTPDGNAALVDDFGGNKQVIISPLGILGVIAVCICKPGQMAHAPADTPAVSLQIPVLTGGCTNHRRQTLCNRWFFSNHQLHNLQPPIHSANYQTVFLQCCVLRQV